MSIDKDFIIQPHHIHLLTKEQAWHYRVLPTARTADGMSCYCETGADMEALSSELEVLLGCRVDLEYIPGDEMARLLSTYYIREAGAVRGSQTPVDPGSEGFLMNLIAEAKNLKSSDIHIERYEHQCRVRIRIDGMMVVRYLIKNEDYPALINKIKIRAGLDIAERRRPQDGRVNFKHGEMQFDIRVSSLPTLYGEKVVMRLLNNNAGEIDLNNLGFSEFDLDNYLLGAKRPNGILLISGPTGSGKTTTLYATLKLLNKETRNVLTIEDPIEYTLQGVNQVQLNDAIGLTFAAALKTFLRQDPDVIMVGEIRDQETANIAIRAAQTGHLVLSTIHTNSAWGTVARLIDMGVPPFLIASTLNTTVAQRLLRLLCPACKAREEFKTSLYPRQFRPYSAVTHHYLPRGCELCYHTGYSGRKAVYEVIPVDQELAAEIKKENMNIQELLAAREIHTLAENAFNLFKEGLTSIEEIFPLLLNY